MRKFIRFSKQLCLLSALGIFGCGEGLLDDESTEKDSKDVVADGADGLEDNDDESWDKDEDDQVIYPTNLTCETIVAESFPMQVFTTCQGKEQPETTVEFVLEYLPLDAEKITVKLDGTSIDSFAFDGDTNTLSITGLETVGTAFELKVSYDSEKKYEKTTAEELMFGFVEDASGLDGCTWLIKTGDDGITYEPLNLPEEFQIDGIYISFKTTDIQTDVASICMAGELINVKDITKIETSCTTAQPSASHECKQVSSGCFQGMPTEEGEPQTISWVWVEKGKDILCAPSAG
jgi:hypothetical protein